jgi:hypothetical protein
MQHQRKLDVGRPVLLSANRADLVAGCTLPETFKRFVLDDPGLGALVKRANTIQRPADRYFEPGEAISFQCGYCLGPRNEAIWPVGFKDRNICRVVHPDPEKRSAIGYLNEPDPPEIIAASDEFTRLYAALMEMLRIREIEAHCIPAAPGYPAIIPRSIWSHPRYYFDAKTGDVFESNPEAEDENNWLVKRWIGAELRRGNIAQQPEASTPKPSAISAAAAPALVKDTVTAPAGLATKERAVHFAIVALWPTGIPAGLTSGDRDKQILDWQKAKKLSISSSSTIKRYFRKMRHPSPERPNPTLIGR